MIRFWGENNWKQLEAFPDPLDGESWWVAFWHSDVVGRHPGVFSLRCDVKSQSYSVELILLSWIFNLI